MEEVRGLLESGLSGEEKPFESLGYKQALAHLRGQMSLEQALASTEIETRQYAKRQLTWFRRDSHVITVVRRIRVRSGGRGGLPWRRSVSSCQDDSLALLQRTPKPADGIVLNSP